MSSGGEIAILVAFVVFVGAVGHFRLKLDEALAALPIAVRDRLGLESQGGSPKRRRRRIADRMTIYGLPDWVPLAPEGRGALKALRLLMLGFLVALAFGPALLSPSLLGLLSLPIVLVVVAARALAVGPWPDPPE